MGLYVVLWGKGQEMKKKNQLVPSVTKGPIEIIVMTSSEDNTSINKDDNNSILSSKDSPNVQDLGKEENQRKKGITYEFGREIGK